MRRDEFPIVDKYLKDVLEDIKAEIEHKADNSNGSICDGLYDALKIIDKYI